MIGLVLVGCGGGDESDPQGSQAADTSAAPSGGGPLTAEQYEQLMPLYRASIAVEASGDETSSDEYVDATRALARACDEVDRDDRLLNAMVKDCEQSLTKLLSIVEEDCSDPDACATAMGDGAQVMRRMVRLGRESNQVIAEEVESQPCKRALSTPARLSAVLEEMAAVLDDVAKAIGSGNAAEAEALQARMEKATARMDELPTARATLKRFQRACAPSA
jgi:hypothetical protein